MKDKKRFPLDLMIGLIFFGAGILLLINNFIAPIDLKIWEYWPLILILIGVEKWVSGQKQHYPLNGIILIILGTALLLNHMDLLRINIIDLWPVLLIILGISIIKNNLFAKPKNNISSNP